MTGVIPVCLRNHDVDMFIEQGIDGFYADTPEELADFQEGRADSFDQRQVRIRNTDIIEGETDFRPLRGRLSLVRLILPQPGRDWRRVPHRLVEFAVEMDLLPQLDGGDLRWRSGMNVLRY